MKITKNRRILIACVFLMSCTSPGPGTKTSGAPFDLYLLAGQSNMAGRGVITDSLKNLQCQQVWMLNKNGEWVTARHPLHYDKPSIAGVGPGLSFAMEMVKASPGVKIGLIPCAVGGTPIDQWQPGAFDKNTSTHPFDDAAARISHAMKYGKVKGMLWLQGEGDSREERAMVYLDKLEILVKRMRKVAGNRKMPVVIGELGRFNTKYQALNKELSKASSRIKFLEMATSEELNHKGDSTHFDAISAIIYGKRFAEKMLQLQSEENK